MLREELNEKDTWDLTTIFANNEEFEKAFNNANIEIENYYNFYVYKYAIGLTGASKIVKRIRAKEPHALEDYFEFLKIGNKKNPIESLKVADVDFTNTNVFDSAIQIFDELIDEFEKLYKEL